MHQRQMSCVSTCGTCCRLGHAECVAPLSIHVWHLFFFVFVNIKVTLFTSLRRHLTWLHGFDESKCIVGRTDVREVQLTVRLLCRVFSLFNIVGDELEIWFHSSDTVISGSDIRSWIKLRSEHDRVWTTADLLYLNILSAVVLPGFH